jgi:2-phosphoglycerate kinase
LFRGKAATGKTTISDMLSRKLGLSVFRKDTVYDATSEFISDHSTLSKISYNVLTKIIQTNIDLNNDFIVDIALPHNPMAMQFFNGIDFKDSKVYHFLFTCSDDDVWKERMQARTINPLPNQNFKSVEEAWNHYANYDISAMKTEIVIDSMENLDDIFSKIMNRIVV